MCANVAESSCAVTIYSNHSCKFLSGQTEVLNATVIHELGNSIVFYYIDARLKQLHQPHVLEGLRMGLSSRRRAAETILSSLRFFRAAFCCSTVFPSFNTTVIFEFWCVRVPKCPRPRGSIRVGGRFPLVIHASAN